MKRKCDTNPELFSLPTDSNNYDWVDFEVVGTQSKLTTHQSLNQTRAIILPCPGDTTGNSYTLSPAGENERVCSLIPEGTTGFYFYEEVITRLGITLPFTDFEIGVLNHLRVAPSQLHPNGWAFIKAFEQVCSAMDWTCNLAIFFYLFSPQCNSFVKGGHKKPWVSLKSRRGYALFSKFSESWKGFKPFFFKYNYVGTGSCWFTRPGEKRAIPRFPLQWNAGFFG